MIHAREASEKLANMTTEERLEAIKIKVSESTQKALDKKIHEVIARYERRVDIVLKASVCSDPDKDIKALLEVLGYTNVTVTSDFPGYCETYTGTTTIGFTIP